MHGDSSGRDEANAANDSGPDHDLHPQHDVCSNQHPLREAGEDSRSPHGAALSDPAGEPRGLRYHLHAHQRRHLRPVPGAIHEALDQQPQGDLSPAEDGGRNVDPHPHHDDMFADGTAEARCGEGARCGAERRGGSIDHLHIAAAVCADGDRRRLPGGGQVRVLLRPGAGGDEELGHIVRDGQLRNG